MTVAAPELLERAWAFARAATRWLAGHTGIPVTLAAALLLVASWNVAKRASRFLVQVVVVFALVVFATEMGWIRW